MIEITFTVAIAMIAGVAIGIAVANFIHDKKKTYGVLKVDTKDPDGPFLFLEMSPDCMEAIERKDTIILEVENISR